MATVREYYEKAFPYVVNVDGSLFVQSVTDALELPVRNHLDFVAHARFVSVFLPQRPDDEIEPIITELFQSRDVLMRLLGVRNVTLPKLDSQAAGTGIRVENNLDGVGFVYHSLDGLDVRDTDLPFTGRLYVYAEKDITSDTVSRLFLLARSLGIVVSFRGPTFASEADKVRKPVAFISHDSRDIDEVARPLALGLQRLMVPVWYDEFSLHVGNSLRGSIEKGLKTAKFCILVLTPNFLSKGGWPKREYDIAFTREIVEDSQILLPVWHNVSRNDVYEYSPILADRVGVPWALGADEVCRRLYASLDCTTGDV
jgi:hypothetical protein